MRRVLLLVPMTAVMLLTTPALHAAAAPSATTGERCTIIGSAGDDVLIGTPGRDVICGRGGNDTLRGRGGNDVLDGGRGTDTLKGGSGSDTIVGGRGNDTLRGEAGNDRLAGESGRDDLKGGEGSDRVNGGSDADRVAGDAGSDTLYGDGGRDVVSGGSGADGLFGGEGPDTLLGQGEDDRLDGQAGPDSLDGGAGTNWCVLGAEDRQKACAYDKEAPKFLAFQPVGEPTVDVTDATRRLVLRLHATDDTGVTSLFLSPGRGTEVGTARLVSGTVRDGWWESTVEVLRYSPPGSFSVQYWLEDRVGHRTTERVENVYTVIDRNPDITPPQVSDVKINPVAVDVRTTAATVSITARITDDLSGPKWSWATLYAPNGQGGFTNWGVGGTLERVAGTPNDGLYRTTFQVAAKQPGGTWSLEIMVGDHADSGQRYYYGEDYYRWLTKDWTPGWSDPLTNVIPGGRLDVRGITPDASPPQLLEVRADRATVDTLGGPVTAAVDVHVTDLGDGLQEMLGVVEGPGIQSIPTYRQISGTAKDGWYRFEVTFPQGTPPGRYVFSSISLRDRYNARGYRFPGTEGLEWMELLPAASYKVGGAGGWDGVITVVNNPLAG